MLYVFDVCLTILWTAQIQNCNYSSIDVSISTQYSTEYIVSSELVITNHKWKKKKKMSAAQDHVPEEQGLPGPIQLCKTLFFFLIQKYIALLRIR